MEAVVMAAGEGTRLRPLTERWAKAVLPIDGRPVIATLLRELAAAGFKRVTVVTGHLGDQVEARRSLRAPA
jgi:NDP-sugar pyrophosphorylase family protein